MNWKPALIDALEWAKHVVEASWGSIVGAAIAQAYKKGLGWRERVIQWCVSYTVAEIARACVLAALPEWHDAFATAVAAVVGLVSFAALHVWQQATVETGARAIRDAGVIWRHLMQGWAEKLGGARTARDPEPPTPEGDG